MAGKRPKANAGYRPKAVGGNQPQTERQLITDYYRPTRQMLQIPADHGGFSVDTQQTPQRVAEELPRK